MWDDHPDRGPLIWLDDPFETFYQVTMETYKRNQVEEAISRAVGETSAQPSQTLRTQLKRLLDTDRSITLDARKAGSSCINYAFYSSNSPGRGTEVSFSNYEAFALETGWRLLEHGWPQSFVVNALRHVRSDFEKHHSHILGQDPVKLFDEEAIKADPQLAYPGLDNIDPVFLTVVTGKASYADGIDDKTSVKICRGMSEVSKFVKRHRGHSWNYFELVNRAHQLAHHLSNSQPRMRGRS